MENLIYCIVNARHIHKAKEGSELSQKESKLTSFERWVLNKYMQIHIFILYVKISLKKIKNNYTEEINFIKSVWLVLLVLLLLFYFSGTY